MIRALAALAILLAPKFALAENLEVQSVTDGVWALVGQKEQRSPENLANNATFGLVETNEGLVLIDPGGSWSGAQAIHEEIRRLSDKPVRIVINSGGQDHRWLGNGYWKSQGATFIASQAAVDDHKARVSMQTTSLSQLLGAAFEGTEPVYAEQTFADTHSFEPGEVSFEIVHPGPAHTPGDRFVWVPLKDTVFAGDIVYVERILGVGDQSSIANWPKVFEILEAIGAAHVVPGHGHATTMARARADTYYYLTNLRTRIGALIEEGRDIMAAPKVDQAEFSYLEQFDSLAGRNAQTAFQQMASRWNGNDGPESSCWPGYRFLPL